MPLTREENEGLVCVGPGTPAGELLRRYWLPISVARELTPEQPTKFVRVLGENLVLFRDTAGRMGLIQDRCPHRGASLAYGRVEERGISCAYHGWLYDTRGNILETPPERNEAIIRSVTATAYPVQQFDGLIWTYMGPEPAPVIPHYDVWVRKTGRRRIFVQPQLDCNWFQAMENSVDPAHLQILHQETAFGGRTPVNTTRGFTDDVEDYSFYIDEVGIQKKRVYKNGKIEEHPVVFPNILRQGNATQIRVPIDDTHTRIFFIRFEPSDTGEEIDQSDAEISVEYVKPYKTPADQIHPYTHFHMDAVQAQDHMAWETQGPLADRSVEHLSYSDRGVVMLRKLLREQIERVQAGEDPLGLQRDPNHAEIDTKLTESLAEMGLGGAHNAYAPPREAAVARV